MSQHDANSNTALFSRGHLEKAPRGTSWWAEPKPREAFMAEAEAKAAEMSKSPEAKHASRMIIGHLR
mgnify:CR=1 FL=1